MNSKRHFFRTAVPRIQLGINVAAALVYFVLITFWFPIGDRFLFAMLILGEVFHLWQVIGYMTTIWNTEHVPAEFSKVTKPVDIFITVAGEPVEIVEKTALAALAMDYPRFKVYILNDGFVAKKDNWQEIEAMAARLGIGCITRTVPGGAKAGNINNALRATISQFVAVFDADHCPHPDFLTKTMGYFGDPKVAFVQSPQFYANSQATFVAGGAWEQQELFFGPIMKGKNRFGSAFMCGTNMVIRRVPLEEAGGMCETNIAEDFLTSLFIHQNGWKSVYVPEVLAEGLAPEDFLSYYKQQFRWARGSLEVIFRHNPLFSRTLTWAQKFQYLASASYYLSGVVILIDALLPLAYFYTGHVPVQTSTLTLAAAFLPYIFLTIHNLQLSSNFTYTFRALSFSNSAWDIHVRALWAVLTRQKSSFAVTSKKQIVGNFWYLVVPQLTYVGLTAVGIAFSAWRNGGITASLVTNAAWAILNCAIFYPFIRAAFPERRMAAQPELVPQPA